MTLDEVTQLVRRTVEKSTGWMTVINPVAGPEPSNQYCTINLSAQYKQPYDVVRYTEEEDSIIEHQRSESTITYEVQARGSGSMTALDNLSSYLDSPQRDIDLWPYVGSGGHDDVQDISTMHLGKILEVGVINIDIHANIEKHTPIEFMKNIDISVKKDNTDVVTVTIPKGE